MIVGIGTDIVSVRRIQQAMEKHPRFQTRILTPKEQALNLSVERIAGRWAAKEAIFKAIGGPLSYQSFSILNDENGKPFIEWEVPQRASIWLSLSHEQDLAIAFAVAEE